MSVRMLTRKTTNKFKGCCFVELGDTAAHFKALKMHNSTFQGRVINVELTVGGGGK